MTNPKKKYCDKPNCQAGNLSHCIIFQNVIHKMYHDNSSSVSSLAAPVRINQYVLGNMSKKLEEGMCFTRQDFLYNSQAHWNGHGNIAGNKEIGCASLIICNLASPCYKDQFHFLTCVVGDHSGPKVTWTLISILFDVVKKQSLYLLRKRMFRCGHNTKSDLAGIFH